MVRVVYKYCHLYQGFILVLASGISFAQPKSLTRKEVLTGYVFSGNHIQFNISTLACFKANIKREAGYHPVKAKPAPGILVSFKYQVNFNNHYSLVTGPEANVLGRNFITFFKKDDFSPPLVNDYDTKGLNGYFPVFVLSLPVMLEKRWLYDDRKFWLADAGFRFNVSTGADFYFFTMHVLQTNNNYHNAGGTDVIENNDARPWISVPLMAGHAWLLKNNNVMQLILCANISFTKYVNGTYYIDIPGQPLTQGQYSSTGSFIGLSMHYVFTNANYRIRKAYEKRQISIAGL
jgi:hypothetical protein